MGLMAFGCIMGTGYGLVRTMSLVVVSTGAKPSPALINALTSYLALLSCLSLVLGSLIPFGELLARRMGALAQLRRIYPLWREVTRAVPEVMLPGTRDRRGDDWINLSDPAGRLNRRQVEILDGLSRLRPWMPDVIRDAILQVAATSDEADALMVVMATWIKHQGFAADSTQTQSLLSQLDAGGQRRLEVVSQLVRQWGGDQEARGTHLWDDPRFAPVRKSLGLVHPVQEATS